MIKNENPSSAGFKIAQQILDHTFPEYKGNLNQLKASMTPIIANEMYTRELAIIERERMLTIFNMARVFDNETMEKVVNALNYHLKP